jgi:hypothetical protein
VDCCRRVAGELVSAQGGKAMSRFEQEMVDGYRDGHDLDAPEPSQNRSRSYRHGFANGRDDRRGKPRAPRNSGAESMKVQMFTQEGLPAGQIDIPAKVMQAAFLLSTYMQANEITELQGLRLTDTVKRLRVAELNHQLRHG